MFLLLPLLHLQVDSVLRNGLMSLQRTATTAGRALLFHLAPGDLIILLLYLRRYIAHWSYFLFFFTAPFQQIELKSNWKKFIFRPIGGVQVAENSKFASLALAVCLFLVEINNLSSVCWKKKEKIESNLLISLIIKKWITFISWLWGWWARAGARGDNILLRKVHRSLEKVWA